MVQYSWRRILAAVVLSVGMGPAWAAPLAPPTGDPGQEFIRNDQQRLLEEQQRKLEQIRRLPGERSRPEIPSGESADGCFTITAIRLEGATLLDDATRQALLAPALDTCVTVVGLNDLLRRITDYYVDAGYVTTRAYLPQQDLSQRRLRVVVVEGRIDLIESQGGAPTPRELAMASPAIPGDRLNLRDLEQLIDQLNRLPSNQATLQLRPGDDIGGSRVVVDNRAQRPWRLSLTRDNGGSESSGEQQWNLGAQWDSPFGLADQLVAQWGHDATSDDDIGSGSRYLAYSIPQGYWTLSYAYTQSDYHSLAEANGFTFRLDGESERHRLALDRVLHRDDLGKTAGSVAVSRISTRNDIDGTRIDVSSQRLSELSVGLNHGRRLGNGLFNADLGWHRGLTILGAQRDTAPQTPSAQYTRTTLTLSYLRPFRLFGESFSFTSLANGQWSDDVLYSPQRIALGGQSSVRGFKEQSLSGDSGAYWRNQLTWRHPVDIAGGLVQSLNTTLGYDVGVIHHGDENPVLHGRMSGYALAFGMAGKNLSANITLSRSLESPAFFEQETPLYFSVGVRY
ncbi:ShlB/FhaC/HecB family hemolysin secretion/activation protein [Modicisalibacter radicis]|uniref:ShlB/FhaC/HecB family hemolysin secretion/activation protein n=1 Tax=Halomonas sp. EAR18 TaxID=2518972 RepID=UPI001FCE85BB|nr:ShlB/FhaC/HecB family hemolysin secretion/activation protein [Halomonas sp. EAR18]